MKPLTIMLFDVASIKDIAKIKHISIGQRKHPFRTIGNPEKIDKSKKYFHGAKASGSFLHGFNNPNEKVNFVVSLWPMDMADKGYLSRTEDGSLPGMAMNFRDTRQQTTPLGNHLEAQIKKVNPDIVLVSLSARFVGKLKDTSSVYERFGLPEILEATALRSGVPILQSVPNLRKEDKKNLPKNTKNLAIGSYVQDFDSPFASVGNLKNQPYMSKSEELSRGVFRAPLLDPTAKVILHPGRGYQDKTLDIKKGNSFVMPMFAGMLFSTITRRERNGGTGLARSYIAMEMIKHAKKEGLFKEGDNVNKVLDAIYDDFLNKYRQRAAEREFDQMDLKDMNAGDFLSAIFNIGRNVFNAKRK